MSQTSSLITQEVEEPRKEGVEEFYKINELYIPHVTKGASVQRSERQPRVRA